MAAAAIAMPAIIAHRQTGALSQRAAANRNKATQNTNGVSVRMSPLITI